MAGNSTNSVIVYPTPMITPTGTPVKSPTAKSTTTAREANPEDLKSPTILPSAMYLYSLYGGQSQTTIKTDIAGAIRAEEWRLYALSTGQKSIESTLMGGAVNSDFEYGTLFQLAKGNDVKIVGMPTFDEGLIVQLNSQDNQALLSLGMSFQAKDAIILIEDGNSLVTAQLGNSTPQEIVSSEGLELILVGNLVDDPTLGEIWQSSFVYGCLPADSVSIETCLPQ